MSERTGLKDRKWLFLLVLMGMALPQLRAQSPTAPLAFEVASIKVEKPGERHDLSIQYLPGGRYSARGVPIPLLVLGAYDVVPAGSWPPLVDVTHLYEGAL